LSGGEGVGLFTRGLAHLGHGCWRAEANVHVVECLSERSDAGVEGLLVEAVLPGHRRLACASEVMRIDEPQHHDGTQEAGAQDALVVISAADADDPYHDTGEAGYEGEAFTFQFLLFIRHSGRGLELGGDVGKGDKRTNSSSEMGKGHPHVGCGVNGGQTGESFIHRVAPR